MIILEGTIESIIYRNNKNSYSILRVLTEDGTITMVGYIPMQNIGSSIRVRGEMVYHDKYGEQFAVKKFLDAQTSYSNNMEAYLKTGAIAGIGPTLAARIIEAFGDDTYDIFKNNPTRLKEVKGVGAKTYEKIMESFRSQADLSDIMIELANFGIDTNLGTNLFQKYGENVVEIIKENPYRIMNEEGVGFRTADEIAMKVGIKKDDPNRLSAAIDYILDKSKSDGHTYLPEDELSSKLEETLGLGSLSIEKLLESVNMSMDSYFMRTGSGLRAYNMDLNNAEKYIGLKLKVLRSNALKFYNMDIDSRIKLIEDTQNITFASKQKEAIRYAFENNVLVITGGPGTGKTTILNAILTIAKDLGISYKLAAPTGRAAKRMSETTGGQAQTIHRLLEYKFNGYYMKFERDEYNPLDEELIIVDEMSMVDTDLFADLLKALRDDARLILIGDVNQIPSVGPGNVLGDIIKSQMVSVVELNEVFRQARQSHIVENAHRINEGRPPILNAKGTDFFMIEEDSQEASLKTIKDLVGTRLPKYYSFDPLTDIQVLAPMKKGLVGVENLNDQLQDSMNKKTPGKLEMSYKGQVFRVSDKVMQNRNNYDIEWNAYTEDGIIYDTGLGVYNGDIGFVRNIIDDKILEVDYDGRVVEYKEEDLDDLSLAYAITIHKSQGSEFDCVLIPVHYTPQVLGNRNLIYTAITRGSKLVVLVGKARRFMQMVNNTYTSKRFSSLEERIWEMDRILD